MKKILLLGITLISLNQISAQTSKGSFLVSGKTSFGFNTQTPKVTAEGISVNGLTTSTFSLSPSLGYFIMDNLSVGVDMGVTSTKTSGTDPNSDSYPEEKISMTTSSVTFLPNATYYFPSNSKFRPYLGLGIGYGSNKQSEGSISITSSGLMYGGKGGVVFLLNDNVALDLGINYNNLSTSQSLMGTSIKTSTGTFGINGGVSVFFGG